MTKVTKYILYKAKPDQLEGAIDRKLTHCNRFTDILYTKLDYSSKPIPKKGDRPLHPVTNKDSLDANQFEDGTTHSRKSDWVVDSVETFNIDGIASEFEVIIICWCLYAPILNPALAPVVDGDIKFDQVARELVTV